MRIGLMTDIHEANEHLQWAIDVLKSARVDLYLVLGDLFEYGSRIEETLKILSAIDHQCIYGNHELGLCVAPDEAMRAKYSHRVMDYFARTQATIDVAEFRFSHGMPHWDTTDPVIYCMGDPPWTEIGRRDAFASSRHHAFFMGHYHQWLAANEQGQLAWDGMTPLRFAPKDRYVIVLNAVYKGACALFDTDECVLIPISR